MIMENYDFWSEWKRLSKIEKQAIRTIKIARTLIIDSIPNGSLVAIYVKGSFVRREMREGSDVDIVSIVTENRCEKAVFEVNSKAIQPCIVVPLSLWELKHNKLFTKPDHSIELRARPDRLLKFLGECRLIYGKTLNPKEYPIRDDAQDLCDEIRQIKDGYLPLYKNGEIEIKEVIKELFWLVELKQRLKGKKVNHFFEGIALSVKDKKHIIYISLAIRNAGTVSKKKGREFIVELEKYLDL